MQTFSEYFGLNKSQLQLDFVDIPIDDGDIPLFIDPYTLSKRVDRWSIDCHNSVVDFFQSVLDLVREGNEEGALYMLSGLSEPNQTRLGLSKGRRPRGRGVGPVKAVDLYKALTESLAFKTGLIEDLEDCGLLIENINRDTISDITTNILRQELVAYTKNQCDLFDVATESVPGGVFWNRSKKLWEDYYVDLPVCHGIPVILVPKAIVRYHLEFNPSEYYWHFVLNFLQSKYLSAGSSLVRVLKDGRKKPPAKKTLKNIHPLSKQYLYEFSKEHPDVLMEYRESKDVGITELTNKEITKKTKDEEVVSYDWDTLARDLSAIQAGDKNAHLYHTHMVSILTALFYPLLVNPVKEQEIHEGRKRVDLTFENAATLGFFWSLPNLKNIPSAYIFVECKNYSSDPKNPELDQIAGRFGVNRGKFGLLVCRSIKDRETLLARCRDTFQDDRGAIIPIDDSDIFRFIELRKQEKWADIDRFFNENYRRLVM